jgi:hypothetical protein
MFVSGLFDDLSPKFNHLFALNDRIQAMVSPFGKMQEGVAAAMKMQQNFDSIIGTKRWLDSIGMTNVLAMSQQMNEGFIARQHIATLYQPFRNLYSVAEGLSALSRLTTAATLPPVLLQQSTMLDLVQKNFFQNWNAAANIGDQLRMPAKIEQLQARFGSLFAQLAEASAEAHTEDEAIDTAAISADLLTFGTEILASQRVTADASSKLAAIAERYEQRATTPVTEATAENQIARDTLRVSQQGVRIQIIGLIVTSLMSVLVVLLTEYLAQRNDPADQAITQRQFADMQAQLATFATHAAAPIQAERIALRSVQVRAYPHQTAETVGKLLKNVSASVWATQGKWAQISYLDVDGLPTQGWVRRNSLGWPPTSQAAKKARSQSPQSRRR